MNDHSRSSRFPQSSSNAPLNGHHLPDEIRLGEGGVSPFSGAFSSGDFDCVAPFAEGLGQAFPPDGFLTDFQVPGDVVSASSGESSLAVTPGAPGGSAPSSSTDLLPSAGFVTPGKLAYYSRLAEAPRLDLDFIKAEARAGSADGESRVAAHHGHLCGMARAGLRQTLAEKQTSVLQNLQHLSDDITRTRILLGATREFDDVPGAEPALHWTWPDRLAATLWAGFTATGIAMDFFTWATILRQSDAHFYHNPALAFFFGAVPLALPLSIKVLLGGLPNEDGGDRTLRRVAWLGVVGCLATIAFFTLGHDGINDAANAGFGGLTGEGAPTAFDWKSMAQKTSSMLLMAVAAIFSALCCHFLTGMFKRRRRAGRVLNAQYTVTARQLARLQAISHEERETLGAITGKQGELADEEAALVGSAVNYYRELRTALTQAEQRLSELLQGPGGVAKSMLGQKLRKGGQALGSVVAALALFSLSACGPRSTAGAAPAAEEASASLQTAPHVVLGLSPRMSQAEREQIWAGAGQIALSSLPPGGTFEAWDALELQRICVFTIPRDDFYAGNAAARQKVAAPAMAELRRWLGQTTGAEAALPRLCEPQFLETIARSARAGESTAILLAGSALYAHPRDARWALAGDEFHNDGHFLAPPEVTPFSVSGRERALKDAVVYHAYLRDDFQSEAQRAGEERFLALFIKQQQGILATFTRDLGAAFDDLRRGAHRPILDPVARPAEDKPGTRQISIEPARATSKASAVGEAQTQTAALERIIGEIGEGEKLSTPPPPSAVVPAAQLGFKWSVNGVDVDGYAAHHPGAPELHYACTMSPQGRFWKDWQTAPTGATGVNGFEIISFEQPTDLRQATCWLNLYRGHAPGGVAVTVQVVLDEQHRYSQVVRIPAEEGNRGANSAGRAHDSHWARVNLAEIVGLAPATAKR